MRPILLFIFLLSAFSTMGQTDTSYQLLWYAGKKIKPNVLLSPRGDTVTYDPAKGTVKVISKTGTGKQFDNMLGELNKTPQRLQQMIGRMNKFPKSVLPAYAIGARQAYGTVKEEYATILSNVITLPTMKLPAMVTGKGGYIDMSAWEEDPLEQLIKEFRKYYKDRANDNLRDVPVPPSYDFSYCFTYDNAKNEAYQQALSRFQSELVGTDWDMMIKAMSMARHAELLLEGQQYRRVMREAEMMMDYVTARTEIRCIALIEKYIDDPYKTRAVLYVVLPFHRNQMLMGREEEDRLPGDYMLRALMSIKKVLQKAIDERDYPVALNLQVLFSTERQLQLIGNSMGADLFDRVLKFNQFKLYMNITGKIGADGGYIMSHLRGDNWFSAVPDTTGKLIWHLTGPDKNKAKMNLLAAEFRGPAVDIPYVGTKNWETGIPAFRIDFCNEKPDSMIIYPFHPEGHIELWRFPPPMGVTNATEMSAVLLGCFIDVERTRRDAAHFKDPANVEKLKKEMTAQYEKMAKQYKAGSIPTGLEAQAAIQKSSREVLDMIHQADPGRYIFKPTTHNKDQILVREKMNGKEVFPENPAIEYAWFHLTLEHDPDGPYGLKL